MVRLLSANSWTNPAGGRPSGVPAQSVHSQLVMMNTFPGGTTNGAVVPSGFCTVSRAMPSKTLGHKCPARSDTVRRSLALFGPSPAAPERATNAGESSRATTKATMRDIRAILHRWGRGTARVDSDLHGLTPMPTEDAAVGRVHCPDRTTGSPRSRAGMEAALAHVEAEQQETVAATCPPASRTSVRMTSSSEHEPSAGARETYAPSPAHAGTPEDR